MAWRRWSVRFRVRQEKQEDLARLPSFFSAQILSMLSAGITRSCALQCVAVWCSALSAQIFSMLFAGIIRSCSLSQCAAVCYSVFQRVERTVLLDVLRWHPQVVSSVAMCCNMLRCVAVC